MTPSTGVSNHPIRYTILVKGYVQRVGYRDIVEQIARIHHLTGYVQNLKGYDVCIVAEGSGSDLEPFTRDIIITRNPIHVDSIDVHEEPATGEYPYFEIKRGSPDEELGERFDSAVKILTRMEEKQDLMINLQEKTLGLQEKTIIRLEKSIEIQEETLKEIKEGRKDLDKSINRDDSEIKIELREIREALIQAGIMKPVKSG